MLKRLRVSERTLETFLLGLVFLLLILGFLIVVLARLQSGDVLADLLRSAIVAPILVGLAFFGIHLILLFRRAEGEQLLLPLVGLIFSIGLTMIWRLRGADGVWQQLLRGFIPGMLVVAVFALKPVLNERIRRWAIPISLAGLGLVILTGVFGGLDETGARLALKIGPLPAIQTSELIKLALIIFLAWFIDQEGTKVEARAAVLFGRFRMPALRYFLPGLLFVGVAVLALVRMSDFGAVLILGFIFFAMLYAGFDTRLFATIATIAVAFATIAALVLVFVWQVPTVIENRFLAFQDPWSKQELVVNGEPTGVTIAEGPGYQIQQAVYATVAGGLTGTGLGYGSPEYIPLASSDFIFAAMIEEMGAIIAFAILAFYMILILRIFRIAMMLPSVQVFERLLVTGIGIHFFTQVFVMVGGTMNLIPLTGVTIPFFSLGGSALLTNLLELAIVLAMAQRLEVRPQ